MELGRKIADLRNNINMSQQTLAELLFVSRDLVSKWENGSRRPDYTTIKKLAAIFRVSADEIISKNDVAFKELAECVDDGTELTEEELTGLLNGFLAGLNEKEADIFMKRYYFLLSAPEIASEYRLRDNHIRSILSKTRKKLKRYVREALN